MSHKGALGLYAFIESCRLKSKSGWILIDVVKFCQQQGNKNVEFGRPSLELYKI